MSRQPLAAMALAIAATLPAPGATASDGPPPTEQTLATVEIGTRRLDAARNAAPADSGSSAFSFDGRDIAALPLGDSTPLNQVLLRAPGVVQDAFGQVYVRGDHGNLQYRVNGVVIPEPITGFGQALDTRFAEEVDLLTGALPAAYGFRTAGIVALRTRTVEENSGEVGLLGGGNGHREMNGRWGGDKAELSWFLTGNWLENDRGVENPTPSATALHDHTRQGKGFGYLARRLEDGSRLSLLFGASDGRFQIPDRPGLSPRYVLAGGSSVPSENLDASQRERNRFEILSWQAAPEAGREGQLALFHRLSTVDYTPDAVGDLIYNGIAGRIHRQNDAWGVQGDLTLPLSARHTLKTGLFAQHERFAVDNDAQVFPANPDGSQKSGTPVAILDSSRIAGWLAGLYLQDSWHATDRLTVNVGARYDRVDTVVAESQLSPRLSAVYELDGRTRLHAGYARYFTPPPTERIDTTSVALFQGTTNALPSDANTAVKSERSHYFDLGLSHELGSRVTLGLDAYYRRLAHLQDEGQFGNALVYSAFNYEQGRIYGIELSSAYRDRNLSAYANLAWSRAQGRSIETGQFNFGADELAYIASHWVNLDHDQRWAASAGLSWLWQNTTLSADALYGSGLARGFANTAHLPGYVQVNTTASRSLDVPYLGRLTGRLSLINALDRVYELRDGSGIGAGAPQYGARRTLYLGLSKAF